MDFKVLDDFEASRAAFKNGDVQLLWCTVDALPTEMAALEAFDPRIVFQADWSRGARRLAAVAAVFEQADRFRTPLTPANDPHDHDDHLHLEAHMHLDAAR